MKTANQFFLVGALSTLSMAAAAQGATGTGQASVDTSKWKCEMCKFEDGLSGAIEVGAGYVSDDSHKFGEYTGLHEKGGFLIGEGTARYRGADAAYWNVDASDLGLKSRALDVEGGRQGRYKFLLNYDELPHFISDRVRTPFIGGGGASLTLPAGFPATNTSVMPLAGSLQPFDISTQRKRLGLGGSLVPGRDWEFAADFRRETKEGTKRSASSFFINAAQLVEPVDYVTDQLNASASYAGSRIQFKLAYYGSLFRNDLDSLTWQNPFTAPGFPGAVAGQRALPPDNQFHQISASAGYRLGERTRGTFDLALGRMTQDESFLAPTVNAALAAPVLPRAALDGRVDTLNANLKITSAVTDQLRLNASMSRDDRDNRTPQATYIPVTTDMFLGAPRTNLPYSFTQDKLKLSADYRFLARTSASVGFERDWRERTFQGVDTTRENTFWGKLRARALDNLDVTFKLAHADRSVSGYQAAPGITPPENPLLRKYNMADRTRDSAGLRADFAATPSVNIGVGLDAAEDKYSDSPIGLSNAKDYSLNGDISVILTEQTSIYFFAARQNIKSRQAGSQTFSTPDWSAENKDTIDVAGIGLKHAAIKDKLDIGADFTITRTKSAISVRTGALDPPFPDLSTSLDSLRLYAIYRIRENLSLHGGYWYERYDSDNWALDGVMPATIPNVLTFGELSPRYRVHVIRASVRYKF